MEAASRVPSIDDPPEDDEDEDDPRSSDIAAKVSPKRFGKRHEKDMKTSKSQSAKFAKENAYKVHEQK